MKLMITGLLSLSLWNATAQTALVPGRQAFQKKWIRSGKSAMTWYVMRDTVKMEIGTVLTQVLTDEQHLTVVTEVQMKSSKAPWMDTTIANINSLQPVYHSSYNSQRDMQLNFGSIVTGYHHDKTKQLHTLVSDTTTASYFDSNLYPLLMGWLPLSEGYTQTIAIYDFNPAGKKGIIKANIKNVSSGIYEDGASKPRPVWIVTVADEISDNAGNFMVYYFDKADRKLWKQEINAGGRKMLMVSKQD